MVSLSRHARRLAAIVCAAASILAGFLLVFRLITPASVHELRTHELLTLLGLLVLPVIAIWAFFAQRRAARKLAAVSLAQPPQAVAQEMPEPLSPTHAVIIAHMITHEPRGTDRDPARQADRHRRREDAARSTMPAQITAAD